MDFVGWILYRLDQYVYSPLFVSISLTRKIQVHTNESLTSWTDLYIYPSLMFTRISLLVFQHMRKEEDRGMVEFETPLKEKVIKLLLPVKKWLTLLHVKKKKICYYR